MDTGQQKGATLSRNPLFYLGWRSLNDSRNHVILGGFN